MEIKSKATWWSVTAFDTVECALLQENDTFPEYVKTVYGGMEECPETKRLHFQGAVQLRDQQRLSALKKWLPTAHWEPARKVEALKKYAMKSETAVGEKKVLEGNHIYLRAHELCVLVARKIIEHKIQEALETYNRISNKPFYKNVFELALSYVLKETPQLASQLMNPSLGKILHIN